LTVAPKGQSTEIILHVPVTAMQGEAKAKREAELTDKNPALMFKASDCRKTKLRSKGVTIVEKQKEASYGIQALIVDLYGNPQWLIEHPE